MTDLSAARVPVHVVSLGCARNEVDSEELAARLDAGGFELVDDATEAEAILVNTCGFIEQAKKDSIDTLLDAADLKSGKAKAVVAVGCMAERYGHELAEALPEADAVLGFDAYDTISDKLRTIMAGGTIAPHVPTDRRTLLPITPVNRPKASLDVVVPGHTGVLRRRLGQGPFSPLKIASGCDRRCAFCAIPSFRGSYLSRPADEIVAEARWLVSHGVREIMLVSENTSSYGKEFSDPGALVGLLNELDQIEGLDWIRVSYLQPAELRAGMIEAMVGLESVVDYFDISFQHAAPGVLRRMRRFGDPDSFLWLVDRIRELAPNAGIRSNFIVGFPGETEQDYETLRDFVSRAKLDAVGVFSYSDEDGTEGASLDAHLPDDEIERRRDDLAVLTDEVMDERAAERVGEQTWLLVEDVNDGVVGRTPFQGPESDGETRLDGAGDVGDLIPITIVGSEGVDLVAKARS